MRPLLFLGIAMRLAAQETPAPAPPQCQTEPDAEAARQPRPQATEPQKDRCRGGDRLARTFNRILAHRIDRFGLSLENRCGRQLRYLSQHCESGFGPEVAGRGIHHHRSQTPGVRPHGRARLRLGRRPVFHLPSDRATKPSSTISTPIIATSPTSIFCHRMPTLFWRAASFSISNPSTSAAVLEVFSSNCCRDTGSFRTSPTITIPGRAPAPLPSLPTATSTPCRTSFAT